MKKKYCLHIKVYQNQHATEKREINVYIYIYENGSGKRK